MHYFKATPAPPVCPDPISSSGTDLPAHPSTRRGGSRCRAWRSWRERGCCTAISARSLVDAHPQPRISCTAMLRCARACCCGAAQRDANPRPERTRGCLRAGAMRAAAPRALALARTAAPADRHRAARAALAQGRAAAVQPPALTRARGRCRTCAPWTCSPMTGRCPAETTTPPRTPAAPPFQPSPAPSPQSNPIQNGIRCGPGRLSRTGAQAGGSPRGWADNSDCKPAAHGFESVAGRPAAAGRDPLPCPPSLRRPRAPAHGGGCGGRRRPPSDPAPRPASAAAPRARARIGRATPRPSFSSQLTLPARAHPHPQHVGLCTAVFAVPAAPRRPAAPAGERRAAPGAE
jgi:hypothetical protein